MLRQPHDGYTILVASFIPSLSTAILSGIADYSVDDFSFINFQWFDEELIALNRDSQYRDLADAARGDPNPTEDCKSVGQ